MFIKRNELGELLRVMENRVAMLEHRVKRETKRGDKLEDGIWDLLLKVRTDIEIGREGLINQFPAYLSVKELLSLLVDYLGLEVVPETIKLREKKP